MAGDPESLLQNYESLFSSENTDGAAYFPTCINDDNGEICEAPEFDMQVREGTAVDKLTGCPEGCTINPGAFYSTLEEWKGDIITGKQDYINQIKKNDQNVINIDKSRIKGHQIKTILRSQCDIPQYKIYSDSSSENEEIDQLIGNLYTHTVTSASYARNSHGTEKPIAKALKEDPLSHRPDILPFDISNENWVKDYNNLYYPKPRPTSGSTALEPPKPTVIPDAPDGPVIGIRGPGGNIAEFGKGLYGRYDNRESLCGENVAGKCTNNPSKDPVFPTNSDNTPAFLDPGNGECQTYFDKLVHVKESYSDNLAQFSTDMQDEELKNINLETLCTILPSYNESDNKFYFAGETLHSTLTGPTNCTYEPVNYRLPNEYIDLNLVDKCSIKQLENKLFEEGGMTHSQISKLKDSGRNNTEAIGWIKNLKVVDGNKEKDSAWFNRCKTGDDSSCYRYAEYVQEGDIYEYDCGPGMKRVGGVPKCEKSGDKRRLTQDSISEEIFPEYLIEGESPSWNLNDFKCVPIYDIGMKCDENCVRTEMSLNCVAGDHRASEDVENDCNSRPETECLKDDTCILDNDIKNRACLTAEFFKEDDCKYWKDNPLVYKVNYGLIIIAVFILLYIAKKDADLRSRGPINVKWYLQSGFVFAICVSTLFFQHDTFMDFQNIISVFISVILAFLIMVIGPTQIEPLTVFKCVLLYLIPGLLTVVYNTDFAWELLDKSDIPDYLKKNDITYWLIIPLVWILSTFILIGSSGSGVGNNTLWLKIVYMLCIVFFIGYSLLSYIGFITEIEGSSLGRYNLQKIGLNYHNIEWEDGTKVETVTSYLIKGTVLLLLLIMIYINGDEARNTSNNVGTYVGFFAICVIILFAGSAIYKNIKSSDSPNPPSSTPAPPGSTPTPPGSVDADQTTDFDRRYIRGFMLWLFILVIYTLIHIQISLGGRGTNKWWSFLLLAQIILFALTAYFVARLLGFGPVFAEKSENEFYKWAMDLFTIEGNNTNVFDIKKSENHITMKNDDKLLWDEIVDIIDGQNEMSYTSDTGVQSTIIEIMIGFKYIIHKYGDRLNLPLDKLGLINSTSEADIRKFTDTWDKKKIYDSHEYGPVISSDQVKKLPVTYGISLENTKKIFERIWNSMHREIGASTAPEDIITKLSELYALSRDDPDNGRTISIKVDDDGIMNNNNPERQGTYTILRNSIPIIRFILKKWINDNQKITNVNDLTIPKYCDYTGKKVDSKNPCDKCFSNEKVDLSRSVCLNSEGGKVDDNMYSGSNKQNSIYQLYYNHKEIGGTPNLAKFSCELGLENVFKKTKITDKDNTWSRSICHQKGDKIFADLIGVDGESCSTVMQYADLGENQECGDINKYVTCYNSVIDRPDLSDTEKQELLNDVCGIGNRQDVSYDFDETKTISTGRGYMGEDIIGYEEKQFSSCCTLQVDGNEVPTPSDCLDPNMTYCTFNDKTMKDVYSGIDGVCMPSPSPGSNPCQITDISNYSNPGGTDFISKWGDEFPDWLNVYSEENTNTLRLRYCGEESAAPASMVPACNDSLSIASGKFNNLFRGAIEGDDFRRQCCTNDPSGSPVPPRPNPSGSPTPNPSGSPVPPGPPAPPPSPGENSLRDCDLKYNVDGIQDPVTPFPCSPYSKFNEIFGGVAGTMTVNLNRSCDEWRTSTNPFTPADSQEYQTWDELKRQAATNCDSDNLPNLIETIYNNVFLGYPEDFNYPTALDQGQAILYGAGTVPLPAYDNYIARSSSTLNDRIKSGESYITHNGLKTPDQNVDVNMLLVATDFSQ